MSAIFSKIISILLLLCLFTQIGKTQEVNTAHLKFRQLKEEFATPNLYRAASGAPGHAYYQQQADYDIRIKLDDQKQSISGFETITYHNNSPDKLDYLWLQLDQNKRAPGSDALLTETMNLSSQMNYRQLQQLHYHFDGGFKIESVKDGGNQSMSYTINKTMMRIDLAKPLAPGETIRFSISFRFNINDRMQIGGRSGYEFFAGENNYLYTIAQFYPRMAVYNDVEGWQQKQFLGRGEFTLPFGNYHVYITVPADHVVGATGELQNINEILTATQRERLRKAKLARKEPVMIVTPSEALEAEKSKSSAEKTWHFYAENVRDFAFASSRKFIWDALGVPFGDRTVLAMSYYPKEGNPLWEKYSTKVVAHTLRVYSKYTFDYPYPVAISVHTDQIGMEYPMICFNGGRPESDGTYNERTKYGMIGVIIHEVGHNFFPMIINSDERQWTWMDEGLNSFVQYLTEQEWERDYPSRRGPAYKIVDYMKSDPNTLEPIMTNSESLIQFGNNAYGKPACGLNILRETIMGRELFDFAFKVYAQRWMFRHPSPEDFFRTMEDASGVDLDWFWRGWFYTTEPVDIALDEVKWYRLDTQDPNIEKPIARKAAENAPKYITDLKNLEELPATQIEIDTSLVDFYNRYDKFAVTPFDEFLYQTYLENLTPEEAEYIKTQRNYYELTFRNIGGMVMPLIIEFEFEDATRELVRIPAEIWRLNDKTVSKVFVTAKPVKAFHLDPYLETADIDTDNNHWPPVMQPSRFELYKRRQQETHNLMQQQKQKRHSR